MTIRALHTVRMAVLTMLLGACGAAPGTEAEDVSATLVRTPVSALTTTGDSQQFNLTIPTTKGCNGECCNFICNNKVWHRNASVRCGDCNPFARGVCVDEGGLEDAWWGNCSH